MPDRPHIIIFNPDQWRGDVMGHMGNPAAETPNLDRFSETEAVSFRNAYCQNPVCTPSRCCFMSGWYPHVRGHRSMHRMLRQPDENNLLKTLKDSGYHVWWGGKNDMVPGQHGFDDYCDVKFSSGYHAIHDPDVENPEPLYASHLSDQWRHKGTDDFYSFFVGQIDKGDEDYYRDWDWANVEGAIDAIHNAPDDRPLCLFLAIAYPHPPYGVEEPWFSMIDRDKLPDRIPAPENWDDKCHFQGEYADRINMDGWDEEQWAELRAVYYAMCARVDHQFGLVMNALKENEMYDESAVFFFPDHGDYTGDYGLVEKHTICFEDCLTRVPFLVKPPDDVPVEPGVSDAMVELIDFPATVEELADVEMPQVHFGKSVVPLLTGEKKEHRDAVFCEGGRLEEETWVDEAGTEDVDPDGLYWPKQSLQTEDLRNLGKSVMLRTRDYKLIKRLYEDDELYDLNEDPDELNNVINDPVYAEELVQLERRMLQYFLETGDVVPCDRDERE